MGSRWHRGEVFVDRHLLFAQTDVTCGKVADGIRKSLLWRHARSGRCRKTALPDQPCEIVAAPCSGFEQVRESPVAPRWITMSRLRFLPDPPGQQQHHGARQAIEQAPGARPGKQALQPPAGPGQQGKPGQAGAGCSPARRSLERALVARAYAADEQHRVQVHMGLSR